MTEVQGYVAWLSRLLAEYGSDPEKCEAIKQRDTQDGTRVLALLYKWCRKDHPERFTTITERGTMESEGNLDLVCIVRGAKIEDWR